jgi:hypothetical protein
VFGTIEGAIKDGKKSRNTGNIGHTRHGTNTKKNKKSNTRQQRKLKRRATLTQVTKGKQFFALIRHSSCHSFRQDTQISAQLIFVPMNLMQN